MATLTSAVRRINTSGGVNVILATSPGSAHDIVVATARNLSGDIMITNADISAFHAGDGDPLTRTRDTSIVRASEVQGMPVVATCSACGHHLRMNATLAVAAQGSQGFCPVCKTPFTVNAAGDVWDEDEDTGQDLLGQPPLPIDDLGTGQPPQSPQSQSAPVQQSLFPQQPPPLNPQATMPPPQEGPPDSTIDFGQPAPQPQQQQYPQPQQQQTLQQGGGFPPPPQQYPPQNPNQQPMAAPQQTHMDQGNAGSIYQPENEDEDLLEISSYFEGADEDDQNYMSNPPDTVPNPFPEDDDDSEFGGSDLFSEEPTDSQDLAYDILEESQDLVASGAPIDLVTAGGDYPYHYVMVNQQPIATMHAETASEAVRSIFMDKPILEQAFRAACAAGLDAPTRADFGLKPITLTVEANDAMAQRVNRVIASKTREWNKRINRNTAEFRQCFATALAGIQKGVFAEIGNPLRHALYVNLTASGVSRPERLIDASFKAAGPEFIEKAMAKALELMDADPVERETIVRYVTAAAYTPAGCHRDDDLETYESASADDEPPEVYQATASSVAERLSNGSFPISPGLVKPGSATAVTQLSSLLAVASRRY